MKVETFDDGTEIYIGENAIDNWDLIEASGSDWLWFHLTSFPSCHVVLHNKGNLADNIILSARYCRDNTKYKNMKNIKVSYCEIKNLVKFIPKIGSVAFKSNRQVKFLKI